MSAMRGDRSAAEMVSARKMSATVEVPAGVEMAATKMTTAEVTAAEMAATEVPATVTATAMAAAPVSGKCAAGKDDRKHGDCHDNPGHWHPPGIFRERDNA